MYVMVGEAPPKKFEKMTGLCRPLVRTMPLDFALRP